MTQTFSYRKKQYKVQDLHNFIKNKKSKKISITKFSKLLNKDANKIWGSICDKTNEIFPLTMNDIIIHFQRIEKAELKFPIVLAKLKEGYKILDGWHRLLKAKILNKSMIECIILPEKDMITFIEKYGEY